jgi:hypothetical protein
MRRKKNPFSLADAKERARLARDGVAPANPDESTPGDLEREHSELVAMGLFAGQPRAPKLTPEGARAIAVHIMDRVASLFEGGASDADIARHIAEGISTVRHSDPLGARRVERHLETMFANAMTMGRASR